MCASVDSAPVRGNGSGPARVFVSPSGNDKGSGSEGAPFRTLHRAQAAARKVLGEGKGSVVIELGEGTYRLDRPLTLTAADSGRPSAPVVYRSAAGIDRARITGSVPVHGWNEFRDGIWRTDLPANTLCHTLYESGKRAHKARFPNYEHHPDFPCARGRYLISENGTPKHHDRGGKDVPNGPGWLTYPADDPPPPLTGAKTKLLIYTGGKCDWTRSMYTVRSIDPATRKLVFEARRLPFGVGTGARFFLEDDLSFLDAPGEFYVDEAASVLYYKPMGAGHPDRLGITRPVTHRLVEFRGESHEQCVSNIRLEGLLLEESDCLPHQPLWAYAGHRDGALVWLSNASGIEVRNCHLKNSGRHGVMMVGHNTGNVVTGCLIEHVGLNGVSFANRSLAPDRKSPTEKRCEGNRVHNTRISHAGEIHTYAECVTVFHASDNEVDHCVLDHCVRYGITVRGNTGPQYGPPVTNNYPPSKGNHFHHIRVSHCGQDGGDMGALHCANLNNPGGGSVNTFEQITVADTRAIPSVKDIGPDGIFLDWPKMAMDQVFRNVQIIRSQGMQLRSHGLDNGRSAQTVNVSWEPGFRTHLMDYDSIGLTDDFPAAFGGRGARAVPPPAPRGLSASAPSHDTIVLTWVAPRHGFRHDALYTVYRDGEPIAQVGAPPFTDRCLTERTAYRYQVAARDGDFCHAGQKTSICEIRTLEDRIAPVVEKAWATWDGQRVRVLFSKPMDRGSLLQRPNYTFSPAVDIVAVRSIGAECVELDVSGFDCGGKTFLALVGLMDDTPAHNALDVDAPVPISVSGGETHYPMQLAEDGRLLDCGGGSGDARLFGGAVVREGWGPFGGPALVLDGETGYAEASADFNLGEGDFTLMLWMLKAGGGNIVLSKGNGFGSTSQWSFGWPGKGRPRSASLRVNNAFHSTAAGSIPIGEWVHVAFVKRGNLGHSYVNGDPSGDVHDLGAFSGLVNDHPLRIGRRAHEPDPQYFKGRVSGVRLLDYALTPEAIRMMVRQDRAKGAPAE